MLELSTPQLLGLCGLACGVVMGGVARGARFCTFGAVEDLVLMDKSLRLRAWALAIAVALVLVQTLHQSGVARIGETFYLDAQFTWFSAIVGGLLFGFGMSMVGTCGYGVLVRIGGGDMRALISFLIMGVSAYMAARGITGLFRVGFIDRFGMDLSSLGGQGFPHIIGALTGIGSETLWLPIALIMAAGLIWWCFADRAFRTAYRDIGAGVAIGLTVTAGFAATAILGADAFNPRPVVSVRYVLPLGDTLIWLQTFSGATINFGIGVVIGTVAGAFGVSLWKREMRWEAFDDAVEMRRHLVGAFLMGFGGVTALGCTVGQGMTGMSTLSASAPLALGSIFIGAFFGLHWLMTGGVGEALSMIAARFNLRGQ